MKWVELFGIGPVGEKSGKDRIIGMYVRMCSYIHTYVGRYIHNIVWLVWLELYGLRRVIRCDLSVIY